MNINITEIRNEWLYFLRNSNVFSVSTRGVTTTSVVETFASTSSYLINKTNVKNIRSIVTGVTTLKYGQDYTVDTDYLDTTIKCKITFTTALTGEYTITYDYGTDKIFSDFPRDDLSINSFPRIGFDLTAIPTQPGGFGNIDLSTVQMTTIFYSKNIDDLRDYVQTIRDLIRTNKNAFYYFGGYLQVLSVGPILKFDYQSGKDKIFQINIDVEGRFNYER